jgi:hypothetical protein
MKKSVITLLVGAATVLGAIAQGTVEFDNLVTGNPATSPKIFAPDGTTGLNDGYRAELLYVPGAGAPVVLGAALPFFSTASGGAGFLNTASGGVRTITGVTGTANLMVRAWRVSDGATFAAAQAALGGQWGMSAPFAQTLGGPDPSGGPDRLAAKLVNLQSFSLSVTPVPEPSVILLGMAGASLFLLRRRK